MLAALLLSTFALPGPQDDPQAEFLAAFGAAMRTDDMAEMGRALRRYKEPAIIVFLGKAEARSVNPTADLSRWVDTFINVWNDVYRTDFGRNYDRYMQRLDSRFREVRQRMIHELLPAVNELHLRAVETQAPTDWHRVQIEVEPLIENAEACGDLYFIAFAWNIKGNSWNTLYYEKGGNDKKCLEAYERVMDARQRLGLTNDLFYTQVKKQAAEARARLGVADPETGVVAKPTFAPEKIVPAEGADWTTLALKPGVDEGGVVHPSDLADEEYTTWRLGYAGEVGSKQALLQDGMDPPVTVHRAGFQEFVLECGGKRTESFRIGAKPMVVEFDRVHPDGKEDRYALMMMLGSERDPFQGASMNLAPTDEFARIFCRSVATRTVETDYGRLTIYDLNCDGKFGYPKVALTGAFGLGKTETGDPRFIYRYDGVTLGSMKHSVPYSRWIYGGKEGWFELEGVDYEAGGLLKLRKAAPNLGKVDVSFKGLKGVEPVSLVFSSANSLTEGLLVDLLASRGPAEVPVGRYTLQQGLVRDEKKGHEALILPGDPPLSIEVEEGKTLKLELGAPFTLAAAAELQGLNLLVRGKTLRAIGQAGEVYTRMVGAPLFNTQVFVKGGKSGTMKASTVEEINADWEWAFFPQDALIQVRAGEELPPIRLTIRKHPWFGKLDSGWLE